jgi:hypothetical protein
MSNIIQYKGKIYVFPLNEEGIPDKIYIDRLWFIVKNINKGSFEYITNVSYIWSNHKYYNLEYEPHIMNELKSFNVV